MSEILHKGPQALADMIWLFGYSWCNGCYRAVVRCPSDPLLSDAGTVSLLTVHSWVSLKTAIRQRETLHPRSHHVPGTASIRGQTKVGTQGPAPRYPLWRAPQLQSSLEYLLRLLWPFEAQLLPRPCSSFPVVLVEEYSLINPLHVNLRLRVWTTRTQPVTSDHFIVLCPNETGGIEDVQKRNLHSNCSDVINTEARSQRCKSGSSYYIGMLGCLFNILALMV